MSFIYDQTGKICVGDANYTGAGKLLCSVQDGNLRDSFPNNIAKTWAEAEALIRAEYTRRQDARTAPALDPKSDLASKLKGHDWHFDFSDDRSVRTRGYAAHMEIRRLMTLLGDEGTAMYTAACPWLNGTCK